MTPPGGRPRREDRRGRPDHRVDARLSLLLPAIAFLGLVSADCGDGEPTDTIDPDTTQVAPEALYEDVTGTHLPSGVLDGLSMDAGVGDVDDDGDLDIVIANEFNPNILLINDGAAGSATAVPGCPPPAATRRTWAWPTSTGMEIWTSSS